MNASELPEKEFLSDEVCHFGREKKKLQIPIQIPIQIIFDTV